MELKLDTGIRDFYNENGFAIIRGFLNSDEIKQLKDATESLVEKCTKEMPCSAIFSGRNSQQSQDKYFADSGDKICGFLEETAVDPNTGNIVVPKEKALNKIAHALHVSDPTFKNITFSHKVKTVLRNITSMEKPTLIQSMVIFKHPQVGGEVKPHQDSTYLYAEPNDNSLIGFWIALDEADTENGCLHFVPGSHKSNPLEQRFVRNQEKDSSKIFIYRGSNILPIPKEKLIPAPCKPGDLVLIHGLVIHQSEPNTSNKPRMAYTFHVYDANTKWSPENWLQPTSENTFVPISI